ncbi:hypothetical protein AGMMS49940_14070 [Spirochaetia bacterium]|nr:hypothetical protein AGMMS49940_14070 [Spirochaetia bacterium]
MDLKSVLLDDVLYEYIDDGTLLYSKRVDERVEYIVAQVTSITAGIGLDTEGLFIDRLALYQAMLRYSRDVWSFKRAHHCSGLLQMAQLQRVLHEGSYRVMTKEPHINKQLAFMVYWLSIMRPFRLDYKKLPNGTAPEMINITLVFNEIMTITLIQGIIHQCQYVLKIKEKDSFFRDLSFRRINRSSLEFFFEFHMVKQNDKG